MRKSQRCETLRRFRQRRHRNGGSNRQVGSDSLNIGRVVDVGGSVELVESYVQMVHHHVEKCLSGGLGNES